MLFKKSERDQSICQHCERPESEHERRCAACGWKSPSNYAYAWSGSGDEANSFCARESHVVMGLYCPDAVRSCTTREYERMVHNWLHSPERWAWEKAEATRLLDGETEPA